MKKLLSLEGKTKEQICKEFVEVCKNGTSKDCSKFVYEAKRNGVSYEELCEYKRNGGWWKMSDLTHLFKVGQKVTYRNNDFDAVKRDIPCVVKETYPDHIIITDMEN